MKITCIKKVLPIIQKDEDAKALFDWYKENGLKNIGFEDCDNDYDKDMQYIGKGPAGYYELLQVVSNVARKCRPKEPLQLNLGAFL